MFQRLRTASMLAPALLALGVLVWMGAPATPVPMLDAMGAAEELLPPHATPLSPGAPARAVVLHVSTVPTPAPPVVADVPDVTVPRTSVERLGRTRGWGAAVRVYYGLPAAPTDQAALERLQGLFATVQEPVIRQNLLFLAALALPPAVARPWLAWLATAPDHEGVYEPDRRDARVALAFSGESGAVDAFRHQDASTAYVNRIVDRIEDHDAIGEAGGLDARRTLRAYRAIEVLDRRPYFKILPYRAPVDWHRVGWPAIGAQTQVRLLEAWLKRYPGHPGSDDIALRLARHAIDRRDFVGAARWFSRAATLPDQDVTWGAVWGLVSCCELLLTPGELERLANEDGDFTPNRQLVLYIRARRLAARRGFRAGLDALEEVVRYEDPHAPLVRAFRTRWTHSPAQGLRSGLVPLDPTDELQQRRVVELVDPPSPGQRSWDERRLAPDAEARPLWTTRLAEQFRLWETLAELERRSAGARGTTRADLLYKQAAVFYHQPDVLFPAYAWHTHRFVSMLRGAGLRIDEPGDLARAHRHFQGETYSLRRAIALFERIEREHPDYPAMDRVLFSKGVAWKRVVDYKPLVDWFAMPDVLEPEQKRDRAIHQAVSTFEALVARHPRSNLADDAQRAIRYWRRMRPAAFR